MELDLVLLVAEPRAARAVARELVQLCGARQQLQAEHLLVELDAGREILALARHALVDRADPFQLRQLLLHYACHAMLLTANRGSEPEFRFTYVKTSSG